MRRTPAQARILKFATYEVDRDSGELYKSGVRQKLTGQHFEVLCLLLEHPHEVITREEFQERIWSKDTFVDYDVALRKAITHLRELLGDSAENPRFIETIPRKGYRFIASVESNGQVAPGKITSAAFERGARSENSADVMSPCVITPEKQTAADLTAEMEVLQRQLAPKHLLLKWAVGLTLALVVVLVTVFLFANRPPKTISVAPEIKLRQLTTNSSENPVSHGSISPDGKYLAYTDTSGLHIKVIDSGETRVVPQPKGLPNQKVKLDIGPWFPDSIRFLVNAHPASEFENEWSSADTSIWAVSVLGGVPTKIRDHAVVWSVSPDGTTVSFGTNKGKRGEREIWLMGPNGEQARKFYEVSEDNAVCCFSWSADAKRNAYISSDASGDTMLSQEVKGGPPVTIFQSSELKDIYSIVWLPDERVVYSVVESATAANFWTMRFDPNTGKRIEAPRRLTNSSNFLIYGGSATTDGKRLTFVATSSFFTAYVADLEAGGRLIRNPKHFTLEDSDNYIGDWTPDSKGVIVVEARGNGSSLYKQSLNSDSAHPIVASIAGYVNYVLMTPDGKWAVALIWPKEEGRWLEHPSKPLPIVRIPIDGGVPEIVLQVSSPSPISCSRSPSNICVIAEQGGDHKQMIVSRFDPLTGRGPELGRFEFARDVDAFVDSPICAISPDGTRLAITRSPESPVEIHSLRGQLMRIIPFRTAGKIIALRWAADQQGFFVTRRAPDGTELFHLDLLGNENSLWRCPGFGWGCFASPSPDGRHVGIVDNKKSANMLMMENF